MVEEKEKQQDGKIGLLRIDKWLMIKYAFTASPC